MTIAFNAPSACIVISPAPQSVPDQKKYGMLLFSEEIKGKRRRRRDLKQGPDDEKEKAPAVFAVIDSMSLDLVIFHPKKKSQGIIIKRFWRIEKEIKETIVFFEDVKRRLTHTPIVFSFRSQAVFFCLALRTRKSQKDSNKNDDDVKRKWQQVKKESRQGQENWPCKSSHTQIEKTLFRRNNRCNFTMKSAPVLMSHDLIFSASVTCLYASMVTTPLPSLSFFFFFRLLLKK